MNLFKRKPPVEHHTCPRRSENGMQDERSPFVGAGENKDTYSEGHGLVGQFRGCSYCGSMSGDDFMQAMRDGADLDPTYKNYKAYVRGWAKDGSVTEGKFYFQHLSVEQRKEFVNLLNAKMISFGFPGHFETLPFFIGRE